jgi:4-amino-4-deoxy-L-arabinose transferase-like glycosyltransferase
VLSRHLLTPKLYINNHQIIPFPRIPVTYLTSYLELFYTLGLILKDHYIVKALVIFLNFMIGFSIYTFCKRYISKTAGIFSAVTFCCMPYFAIFHDICILDLPLSLFGFITFFFLMEWIYRKEAKFLYLSVFFSIFSIGIKANGLILFLALSLFFIYYLHTKESILNKKLLS